MYPAAYSLHLLRRPEKRVCLSRHQGMRGVHDLRLIRAVWALPALVSLALAGCGGSDVAVNSPATANDTAPSTGSTSSGGTGSTGSTAPVTATAALSWVAPTQNSDGSQLTNLAGYNIYYGTDPSALTQTIQVANAA